MIVELLISALSSAIGGAIYFWVKKLLGFSQNKKEITKTYSERLIELTSNLTTASAQVDSILLEMSSVAQEKERSVNRLETVLSELEKREQDMKQEIELLQKVPISVADRFAKLIEPGERSSTRRDFLLFFAGIAASIVTTVMFKLIWG